MACHLWIIPTFQKWQHSKVVNWWDGDLDVYKSRAFYFGEDDQAVLDVINLLRVMEWNLVDVSEETCEMMSNGEVVDFISNLLA